mgnify:CR=1 FL=1
MKRLIFFGAGNISQAVISGLVNSGYSKKDIFYIDRNQANSLKLKKLKIFWNTNIQKLPKKDG